MSDRKPGPLVGRGRCADVFAWEDGRVVKLFYKTMSGMAEREYEATRIAHQNGLSVPAVDDIITLDGRIGIVMERVDGPSMEDYMKTHPGSFFDCARMLAELQAKIHSCDGTGLRPLRNVVEGALERDSDWPEPLRKATLECIRNLPQGNAICHWDFHSGNIIMTEKGPVIIDWSESVLGNAMADVAMTWLLFRVCSIPPWVGMRKLLKALRGGFYSVFIRNYRHLKPFSEKELTPWKIPVLAVHVTRGIPEDRPRKMSLLEKLLKEMGYL